RASFLHWNYKQLRGATKTQIESCHAYCRGLVLPDTTGDDPVISGKDICEPSSKKSKFMLQLMDKNETVKEPGMSEIDRCNSLTVEEEYTNPLTFWQQQQIQLAYPTLYRLAKRTFAVPCSSGAVERQFSAAAAPVTFSFHTLFVYEKKLGEKPNFRQSLIMGTLENIYHIHKMKWCFSNNFTSYIEVYLRLDG
ncbi:unnamed protein product, partial [Rotaria socialis]